MTTTTHAPVTTAVCARGCTRLGVHHGGCEGTDERGVDCRGCMPRGATDGLLCWPCYRRLQRMLVDAPIAERWLAANTARTSASALRQDHELIRGGQDGPPAPIKIAVLDHRESLRIVLNGWTIDYAGGDRDTGPGGDRDGWSVQRCCDFFLAHLERLAHWKHVDALIGDLADVLADAHRLAPWRPTAQRVPHVPCPECQRTSLAIFGGDVDVTCTACRTMIPPGRYGIWVRIFEAEHRQAAAQAADRAAVPAQPDLVGAGA